MRCIIFSHAMRFPSIRVPRPVGNSHRAGKQELILDLEKAKQIKGRIAEVIGFDADEIEDGDRFIQDYSISITERRALLVHLNVDFGKDLDLDAFCKLETVSQVLEAYAD